ncbi:MAG: hypothetical protein ACM3PP_03105, partial [Candidatus Saccharibacteria bacterium]
VFKNTVPFATNKISMIILNAATIEKMGEVPYTVKPQSKICASSLAFPEPGKYRIQMAVNGQVVVMEEVNIQ